MHNYLSIIILLISVLISSNDKLLDILYNEDGWELSDVLDDNSSEGFGGIAPLLITDKFLICIQELKNLFLL